MTAESLPVELRRAIVRIARTPRLSVACDYDGTLAPIVRDPQSAAPLPEAVRALRSLAELAETTTAVISGRALRDLATLSRLPAEVHLVGSHGSEFDLEFVHSLDADVRERHRRLIHELTRLAEGATGVQLDIKRASVAVHVRKATRTVADGVLAAPPMDNVHLRQAIASAIDRKALISSILDGVGGTPSDSWTVPGIYGSTEPAARWAYDPDRARQLLAESGLTTPVDIAMAYSTDFGGPVEQTSQAIAGMLKKVGINLRVLAKPGSELGKVHTSTTGAPRPWHAMLGGRTYITGSAAHCIALECLQREDQLSDVRFEQLGETVLHTRNGDKRLELFAQIEQRVAELVPL